MKRLQTKLWFLGRGTLFATILVALCGLSTMANAATRPPSDVATVLDLSGSMNTSEGADRFEALFNWVGAAVIPGDRVSVVAMGTGAHEISPLTAVGDSFVVPDNVPRKREKYTNLAAGLENAYYQLQASSDIGRERVILLYSDAKIDMPGGEWDSRNSMRYLLDSLIPSLKAARIRVVAVVPEGLDADFQLLHELSGSTGGAYYRGLPASTAALFPEKRESPVSEKIVAQAAPAVATPAPQETASVSVPASPEQAASVQTQVVERVVHEGPAGWMIVLFAVFGVVLLGVVGVMVVMFRAARTDPESEDTLVRMLDDVHALKELTAKHRTSTILEDEEAVAEELPDPDSGKLSVSLVSGFLDFEDTKQEPRKGGSDDIVAKPVFGTDAVEEDQNMSLSTMETMLGLPASNEKHNE